MLNLDKIGVTRKILSKHVSSREIREELERFPSMTLVGLGQGGGRIATEFARFGFPTILTNSSKSDMDEHSWIIPEERRIITKSEIYPELEGTDKNAQLGFEIAKENSEIYKRIALNDDVQKADFVWVCVSLGGGTGNGALKVALAYLSKVRAAKKLPDDKIPLGIICSLPSKEERGSSFRRNALAGINLIQSLIDDKKIGSVLVIDNEKMNDYYANDPLKTYAGSDIDAKSYSNMVVASLIVEVATLPLLKGRSVFDKTEYLSTISTPGWLSLSKLSNVQEDDNLEILIDDLYTKSEVLAETNMKNISTGAVAILYPSSKQTSAKIADDVYTYASNLLNSKVNLAISTNSALKTLTLYGMAISNTPPSRTAEVHTELNEWIKAEKELEEQKKKTKEDLGLGQFDDFFSGTQFKRRGSVNFDDLAIDSDFDKTPKERTVAPTLSEADLDDIDF